MLRFYFFVSSVSIFGFYSLIFCRKLSPGPVNIETVHKDENNENKKDNQIKEKLGKVYYIEVISVELLN